jgi:hypothetical protein
MKPCFPEKTLEQHIAVLGKTGSGKTCTAKLAIEHVVAAGARVCILDPIKSDWWGLTSSADGKRAGLPFHILGGPRGHVPLHPQAGAAIGEIVANGQLPLSILDMSEFEMGGLQQFFTHFAPTLLRKMRGVLYLVIEEAHEFAPKERGGFGSENMAIHFAKKLAVAGRSKGIRLIIATQRTQSLHNAMLGSCDTLIAHRMVAPADQEPVVKWLKANLPAEKAKEVAASLQSLKTGEAWICAGELGLFERRQFPRISTFDNTATPTDDVAEIEVKTAAVDQDKLRSIIGVAVEEAKANDPAELKKQLNQLRAELAKKPALAPELIEIKVPDAASLALLRDLMAEVQRAVNAIEEGLQSKTDNLIRLRGEIEKGVREISHQLSLPAPQPTRREFTQAQQEEYRKAVEATPRRPDRPYELASGAPPEIGSGGKRRILIALAQHGARVSVRRLSLLTGITQTGGTWRTYLGELRSAGYVVGSGELSITQGGLSALGDFEPLPTGESLRQYWRQRLGDSGKREIFDVVCSAYPNDVSYQYVSAQTGISLTGGTWRTYLGELRGLELIEGSKGELRACDDLFT